MRFQPIGAPASRGSGRSHAAAPADHYTRLTSRRPSDVVIAHGISPFVLAEPASDQHRHGLPVVHTRVDFYVAPSPVPSAAVESRESSPWTSTTGAIAPEGLKCARPSRE